MYLNGLIGSFHVKTKSKKSLQPPPWSRLSLQSWNRKHLTFSPPGVLTMQLWSLKCRFCMTKKQGLINSRDLILSQHTKWCIWNWWKNIGRVLLMLTVQYLACIICSLMSNLRLTVLGECLVLWNVHLPSLWLFQGLNEHRVFCNPFSSLISFQGHIEEMKPSCCFRFTRSEALWRYLSTSSKSTTGLLMDT